VNLAEAIALQVKPKGPPCSVRTLLETLTEEDRQVMVEALGNPTITHAQLARGVEAAGLPKVLAVTIRRHRLGECGCTK